MTTADLLVELARLGIEVVAHKDRLRYRPRSAVTPHLAERLSTHEVELLAILRPAVAPDGATTAPVTDTPVRWEDCIEPPTPCSKCGGIICWWNAVGDQRCMACDPPKLPVETSLRREASRQ